MLPGFYTPSSPSVYIVEMAETDFTSDVTAENGNNVEEAEEATQEEPNPERKFGKPHKIKVL